MGSHNRSSLLLKHLLVLAVLVDFAAQIVYALPPSRSRRDNLDLDMDLLTSTPPMVSNRKKSKYSCADKEDDGHYEHVDCKKYWHCLYVGTIFEYALERKCPVGTMFHPVQRVCEISTVLTCLNWRKSIYGKNYQEPTTTADLTTTTVTATAPTSRSTDDEEKRTISANNNGDNLRTYLITMTTISTPDLERTSEQMSSSVATQMLESTTSSIDLTTPPETTLQSTTSEPEPEPATTGKPPPLYKKIKSKTTKAGSAEAGLNAKYKEKFTTLFSSNLHEKLKNMNSGDSISLDNGGGGGDDASSSLSIPYAKIKGQGDDLLLNKNFTILTSKVLAAINANRNNSSKAFDQVEIIKSIFSLRNRTQTRPKHKKYTTTTAATTSTSTTTEPIPGDYQNEYEANEWSKVAANDAQLDLKPNGSKASQKTADSDAEKFYVNNVGDKQADDYGEESIETDDLSVLDSDLLLNLQLNTNNNNQYKITNIGKLKKKKKKSKLVKQADPVVELADILAPETANDVDEISLDHDVVAADAAAAGEENSDGANSSESSAQSVDQQHSSSSSSSSSNAFRIRSYQTVLVHVACVLALASSLI